MKKRVLGRKVMCGILGSALILSAVPAGITAQAAGTEQSEENRQFSDSVIFEEDFENNLNQWTPVQGTAEIVDGQLKMNTGDPRGNVQYAPADEEMYTTGDAVYEFEGKPGSSQWFGFQFNMQDKSGNNWDRTGYMLYITTGGQAELGVGTGSMRKLASVKVDGFDASAMTKVKIRYTESESRIRVYFNDAETPAIDVADQTYPGGYFCVTTCGGAQAVFDNLKVQGTKLDAFTKMLNTLIVYEPLRNETELKLPEVPDGYEISYQSSSPEGYLSEDGSTVIRRPETGSEDVNLGITYNVTKTDTQETRQVTLNVPISAEYTEPEMSEEEIARRKAAYSRQKYGLFVHYVPRLTHDSNGNVVTDIDQLADDFDAEQFAKEAHDMGYEYVIFTALHMDAATLYPSRVNKRWRDDRRQVSGYKSYSDRDVIMDLADALDQYDIDLHLYVHPVDGHDFSGEDKELTGWNECGGSAEGSHEIWNQFQNELYDEICQRYQGRIKGLWFDGFYEHTTVHGGTCIDLDRFNKTLRAYDPGLVVVSNAGTGNNKDPEHQWQNTDFWSWELGQIPGDSENPTVITNQAAALVVGTWWATDKNQNLKYSQKQMFHYIVGQAATSYSGGFAVATGCFPGTAGEQNNGNLWAGNFYEEMTSIYNNYIKNVEEAIKNTNAGKAYQLTNNSKLYSNGWGVSTESEDGKYVYLHILKSPDTKSLELPDTDDRSVLGGKAVRMNFDGSLSDVQFEYTENGYRITLPEGQEWDDMDTIIRVERVREGMPDIETKTEVTPPDENTVTTGKWQNAGNKYHTQENAATLEYIFNGAYIEWYGVIGTDHGDADVYIDGEFVETVDCTGERQEDALLFRWEDENGDSGKHTIKLVNKVSGAERYIEARFVYGDLKKTYSIKYEGCEGVIHKNPLYYIPGTELKLLPLEKEGKTFAGWYDAEEGGNKIETISAEANGDKVLYARWAADSKATLKYYLDQACGYVEDGATENLIESVQKQFRDAIEYGQQIMDKEDATEKEVQDASMKLLLAIQSLDFIKGNKTDLNMAVDLAETLKLELYVEKGQAEFEDALGKAREAIEDQNLLQDEVDEIWKALVEAMSALRLKADKSVLGEILTQAGKIDTDMYTSASVMQFETALAKAEEIFENNNLSVDDQKIVDNAADQLENAIENLQEKETQSTDENETDDEKRDDNKNTQSKPEKENVPQTGDSSGFLAGTAMLLVMSGGLITNRIRKISKKK